MEKRVLTREQYYELTDMIIEFGSLRAKGLSIAVITDLEAFEESNVLFDKILKYLSDITDF